MDLVKKLDNIQPIIFERVRDLESEKELKPWGAS